MVKKICGQVNKPTTDDSSPCKEFNYTECVISNRKSDLIKNAKGMNLNEYLTSLEGEIRRLKLENKNIQKIIANLLTIIPEVGIGVY